MKRAFRSGGRRIRIVIADQKRKIWKAGALRPKKPRANRGRMRSFGVNKKRYLLAIPLLAALIALACVLKFSDVVDTRYRPLDTSLVNPLMGWAVEAETPPDQVEIDHSLVYATVTWRELESEMGVYDFEAFEKKNHLPQWWALGKRLVLRFVMDVPSDESHMDIPDWLYNAMGDDAGEYYENSLGKGFSPNYTNIALLNAHRNVINALGERYDDHNGIAFVEIGSVGHFGSWTTKDVQGDWVMPPNEDITQWMGHYARAFTSTKLLASKPYQPVRVIGMGLYNDRLGNQSETWDWIDMIEYGGFDQQTGADFRAMPQVIELSLCGGRIDRGVSFDRLFTLGLDSLVKQIGYCHTTYVSGIRATGLSEQIKSAMSLALDGMGYRLWLREAMWPRAIRRGYCLSIDAIFRNDGRQSFVYDWPMELALMRGDEVAFKQIVDCDVRSLAPGQKSATLRLNLPGDMAVGRYSIALAILDPRTNKPAVDFAMDVDKIDLRAVLGEIEVYI